MLIYKDFSSRCVFILSASEGSGLFSGRSRLIVQAALGLIQHQIARKLVRRRNFFEVIWL